MYAIEQNENGFCDKALYLLTDLGEVVRRPYLYTGGAGQVEVPGGRTEGPPKAEEQEVRIICPCTSLQCSNCELGTSVLEFFHK